MTQRTREEYRVIDDALRDYYCGNETVFNKYIKAALERTDPLTQKLIRARAVGLDWRQITMRHNVSASTYYSRLRLFRATLCLLIENP